MKADAKQLATQAEIKLEYNPAFAEVARKIAKDDPPLWLLVGLTHFSNFVGLKSETAVKQKDYMRKFAKMYDAAKYLTKFLPLYQSLPLGLRCPDEVATALDVLPRIRDELEQIVNAPSRGGGQLPNIPRKTCAAVIVEAWRIARSQPEPDSRKLWDACDDYWQACGHKTRGEIGQNWQRDAVDAVADNHEWIRQTLLGLQNKLSEHN